MRPLAAVFCVTLVFSGAATAGEFSESQLRLARAIGAVIRLSKTCEVPIPSGPIAAAMRAEKVPQSAMLDAKSAFRAEVQEQANTVAAIQALRGSQGHSASALREDACAQLMQNYGPNGSARRGLYQTR